MIVLLLLGTIGMFSASTLLVKAYQVLTGPGRLQTVFLNVVSGCTVFIFLFCLKGFRLHYSTVTLLLAVFFGVFFWVYSSLKVTAAGLGPMAVLSMSYVMGGISAPALYGFFFLNEPATINKIISIGLAVLSFVPLLVSQKKSLTFSPKFLLCCALLLVFNGLLSTALKIAQTHSEPQYAIDYVALYYFFYFLTSLAVLGAQLRHITLQDIQGIFSVRSVFYMALVGLLNAFGGICNYQLGFYMQASVQFPLTQCCMLVAITVISMIMYREKPSRAVVLSLTIALSAIVLISV